jgi:malate/lactate dehydrogenase
LGRKGIEKVVIYDLDKEEKESLKQSAEAVRQTTNALRILVNI